VTGNGAGPPDVVFLGGGPPLGAGDVGGKGASLDLLIRSGFEVPPTAALTAAAYRRVADDPGVRALIERVEAGEAVLADTVDRAFLDATVPDRLAAGIVATAARVGAGGPIAVRSSATAEDLSGASFAGQYRSSLNIEGAAALLHAVRLTWASLWHPAPVAYRRAWGIPAAGIAMPVLLMRMVAARWAGVVFTADPSEPDRVRVEAVPGLGEALVSGARTPDVWLLSRDGPSTGPDIEPDRVARAAAALALRIERVAGSPQDVEWAHDGERLWLIQSRPITVGPGERGDGCDTAVDSDELTTAGIAEMLPGVLPPLVWDINAFLVEEALRDVLGQVGARVSGRPGPPGFIRRVRGRAALDLDLLKTAAATVPGGSPGDLEREYFGVAEAGSDAEAGAPAGRLRLIRHGGRVAASRRRSTVEAEIVVAAVDEVVRSGPELSTWADGTVLAYQRRLIDLGARAMTVELAVAAAAAGLYRKLEDTLATHLGTADAATAVQRMTAGATTVRPAAPAASRSVFAGPSWSETGASWTEPAGAEDGERGGDRDRAARREIEKRLRSSPRWRRVRWLTGQVVDVRIHVLRRLVVDVTDGLRRRERVKAAVLALGGETRRVDLEIGRRLCERGLIGRAGDVDLLRRAELTAALAGSAPSRAELDRRRRGIRRWAGEPPLPERFVGSPPATATAPASAPGDHLRGWAASPGRYTGRARTVTDPVGARFDRDEVLVAVATDAGWSPLIMRAGAVVVERGGPLSHAAIVARELGVPAVLNLPGAAAALDGQLVTVDGSAGEVIIHSESGAP
jgi:pyruvate,water dikinase